MRSTHPALLVRSARPAARAPGGCGTFSRACRRGRRTQARLTWRCRSQRWARVGGGGGCQEGAWGMLLQHGAADLKGGRVWVCGWGEGRGWGRAACMLLWPATLLAAVPADAPLLTPALPPLSHPPTLTPTPTRPCARSSRATRSAPWATPRPGQCRASSATLGACGRGCGREGGGGQARNALHAPSSMRPPVNPSYPLPTPSPRPLIEQRIAERQALRAQGRLPGGLEQGNHPAGAAARPHHREGLTIPRGSLQRAM